jgi:hypothetical protein
MQLLLVIIVLLYTNFPNQARQGNMGSVSWTLFGGGGGGGGPLMFLKQTKNTNHDMNLTLSIILICNIYHMYACLGNFMKKIDSNTEH